MSNRNARLLTLVAETFVHVGTGQQAELIDLPFARETHSGFPFIPGSGIKGAMRDLCRANLGGLGSFPAEGERFDPARHDREETREMFGAAEDGQGSVLFGDARLFALPVRSLDRPYRLVTSVERVQRLIRDLAFEDGDRADVLKTAWGKIEEWPSASDEALGTGTASFVLEEFSFSLKEGAQERFKTFCAKLEDLLFPSASRRPTVPLSESLVIVDAEAFSYFTRNSLHVRMRNALDPRTKTVLAGALWSEESLPPETIMTCLLSERPLSRRQPETADKAGNGNPAEAGPAGEPKVRRQGLAGLACIIRDEDFLFQVGGNETVGEGWFSISWPMPRSAEE